MAGEVGLVRVRYGKVWFVLAGAVGLGEVRFGKVGRGQVRQVRYVPLGYGAVS